MRDHLYKCLTTRKIEPFPVFRTRRKVPAQTLYIPLYSYRCADDGQGIVGCDRCEDWFHIKCTNTKVMKGLWYCKKCRGSVGGSV